jgi:hypothetical protein
MYLVFSRTSPDAFVEARYTGRLTTDTTLQVSAQLHAGEAPYTALDSVGRNRWGDYSGIAVDPSDGAVWAFHQYASTPANTWRTWVGRLAFPNLTLTISKTGSGSGNVTSNPPGINCGATCSAGFPSGTVVSLSAFPSTDSVFTSWGGDNDCLDASVMMSSNRSCSAKFRLKFTDEDLISGISFIKGAHITELRNRINRARGLCGLPDATWTDPFITAGVTTIRGVHIDELRSALSAAYSACNQPVPNFTDPSLIPASTVIKRIHIIELREAVNALD